jgi:metallo-beta-lactamase family protein
VTFIKERVHMPSTLHFHGAAGCVTGSCIRLQTPHGALLIDCGMFQGSKTLKALNYDAFPFDPKKIDAVLLTHAHIDHCGLLPKLRIAGFEGSIFATAGTRALCSVMLPDSGAIQENEVEMLNRRNRRRGGDAVTPIYTAEDARETMPLFSTVAFDRWTDVCHGVRARWWRAGHILGSASIEVEIAEEGETTRLLFSGDIGPGGRDFTTDAQGPQGVDHIVVESTYGGVERAPVDTEGRRLLLAAQLKAAHAAGGPLLIPAFAVERTQELLLDLLALMESNAAPPGPIFLDSPLAIKATNVFLSHGQDHRSGQNPFSGLRESTWLRFTESAAESREIERFRGWHIIIAASGMCDAGRVRHHLKRLLWKPDATIMLVGYQAMGTLGRLLADGRKDIRIRGEPIRVRASIRQLDAYSGHADANALTQWVQARAPVSGSVFIVHGEPENAAALDARLRQILPDNDIIVPKLDQRFSLSPNAAKALLPFAPRLEPGVEARLDWHNARAELLSKLDRKLRAAPDDSARQRLLEDLEGRLT